LRQTFILLPYSTAEVFMCKSLLSFFKRFIERILINPELLNDFIFYLTSDIKEIISIFMILLENNSLIQHLSYDIK